MAVQKHRRYPYAFPNIAVKTNTGALATSIPLNTQEIHDLQYLVSNFQASDLDGKALVDAGLRIVGTGVGEIGHLDKFPICLYQGITSGKTDVEIKAINKKINDSDGIYLHYYQGTAFAGDGFMNVAFDITPVINSCQDD